MESEDITRFEGLCLRWARGALIATIALGCLGLVGGLVAAGAVWLWPGPAQPSKPAAFGPIKYDLKMAEKWAAENDSRVRQIQRDAQLVDRPSELPQPLASLLPNPPYAPADVWETYCKAPTDYGCLEKGRRLITPTAARTFDVLFQGVDDATRVELTKALVEQLPSVALEKRLGMAGPILFSYVALKKQNDEAAAEQESKARDAENSYSAAVASHRETQSGISLMGLYVAGWGLGVVLSASIFVALLAIERHLRAIRSGSQRTA